MTIYEIKKRTQETTPYYFTRQTLKFFGQTLKDFRVYKQLDGRYMLTAPIKNKHTGEVRGKTIRYFNPLTNELQHK